MRFASLGSGSRGNATLVEAGGTRLLVDCGFSAQMLVSRLAELDVAPDSLDAVLVTHEHGDHIRGVPALCRRFQLPVWMTSGTCHAGRCRDLADLQLFHCHDRGFRIGDIEVEPYAVPHDAREPSQFVFRHKQLRLGLLTDAGAVTPHVRERLAHVDALILECNHDPAMLAAGPYPPALQRRVGGNYGHLSNRQAADLLGRLDRGRLRYLVAAHLSEKNNSVEKAREALLGADREIEPRLRIAAQDSGTGWLAMGA
jgi:phosphoribosyl 1,2-cyclic phosphodiesterase